MDHSFELIEEGGRRTLRVASPDGPLTAAAYALDARAAWQLAKIGMRLARRLRFDPEALAVAPPPLAIVYRFPDDADDDRDGDRVVTYTRGTYAEAEALRKVAEAQFDRASYDVDDASSVVVNPLPEEYSDAGDAAADLRTPRAVASAWRAAALVQAGDLAGDCLCHCGFSPGEVDALGDALDEALDGLREAVDDLDGIDPAAVREAVEAVEEGAAGDADRAGEVATPAWRKFRAWAAAEDVPEEFASNVGREDRGT